jgi:hypothetical protein
VSQALRRSRRFSKHEEDFLRFSYGFQPGRQHNALDALHAGMMDIA